MSNDVQAFALDYFEGHKPVPGETSQEKLGYAYLDEGHIDSFEIMNMIMLMEQRFAIRFSEEDLQSDEIRTIGGLVAIIERLLAAGATG